MSVFKLFHLFLDFTLSSLQQLSFYVAFIFSSITIWQFFLLNTDKGVVQPLLTGITDDIALLPLAPGNTYKLLAAAEDNVGNIQKPRLDDPQAFMTIYIPEVKRMYGWTLCFSNVISNCAYYAVS